MCLEIWNSHSFIHYMNSTCGSNCMRIHTSVGGLFVILIEEVHPNSHSNHNIGIKQSTRIKHLPSGSWNIEGLVHWQSTEKKVPIALWSAHKRIKKQYLHSTSNTWHYWKPYFPCVFPISPSVFLATHREINLFLSVKKTHSKITKHIGKYTFSCRLRKNTRGNFCTHREIQLFPCRLQKNRRGNFRTHRETHRFLVGCRKTHREIYIHTGKFMNSQ